MAKDDPQPAGGDPPRDSSELEDQLSGLAESHFDRKKRELQSGQQPQGQMFGKLKSKFDGLTRPARPETDSTPSASVAGPVDDTNVEEAIPVQAEPVPPGDLAPASKSVDEGAIQQRLASIEASLSQAMAHLADARTADAAFQQAMVKIYNSVQQQDSKLSEALAQVGQRIGALEAGIGRFQTQAQQPSVPQAAPAAAPVEAVAPTATAKSRSESRLIPRSPRQAEPTIGPPASGAPDAAPSGLHGAIFGQHLAACSALTPSRSQLIEQVLAGRAAATALAGQLLLYHASEPDRRIKMLKDIGEAFYRWRPDAVADPDGLRQALAQWLTAASQQTNTPVTIELARPGDRFDVTRHSASRKGAAEVTAVYGWIVLRENGKVYTKGSVAVG